jgi:pimeloyl-ACP methyl ester carboxylesterase
MLAGKSQLPFTETLTSARRAAFVQLAASGPVQETVLFTGLRAWLVTGHAEAREDAGGDRADPGTLVPDVVGTAYRAEQRVLDGMRPAAGNRPESVVAAILYGAFGADIRHLVGKVAVPVLAATGTEDLTCPPAMTEEIAAATGTSPLLLDGVGHLPMLGVPVRVGALIDEHIAGVEAGAGR